MVSQSSTPPPSPLQVGVYGASGTAGAELISLLGAHPHLSVAFATSRGHAGQTLRDVDPALPPVPLTDPSDVAPGDVDVVFCSLPHGTSAGVVAAARAADRPVVDLSADFRLRDGALHAATYGSERDPRLATEAVYGLPELNREEVRRASLVANPGCYPTCTALALAPVFARGWATGTAVVDAKSGVSGAGRSPSPKTHFLAVDDDVKPYNLGRAHRHAPEIEQTLARVWPSEAGPRPALVFNPHVVPMARGMLATCVVQVPGRSADDVRELLAEHYRHEPLVEVLEDGPARVRAVVRTNRAQIGVAAVNGSDHVVITSTIDNLGKGAAGQALQNANLLLGLDELTGLGVTAPQPSEVA